LALEQEQELEFELLEQLVLEQEQESGFLLVVDFPY
jgi:hypothetical protein